jgi:hypothetical protein
VPGRRRRGALVGGASAALVAAGARAGYRLSAGSDDAPALTAGATAGAPSATADRTPSSAASSLAPLATPPAPDGRARAGYRAVSFVIARPRPVEGVEQRVEYDAGSGWTEARRRLRVPTEQGGERACIRLRTVVSDDAGRQATSPAGRVCGRAAPRTVELVRTPGDCSDTINGFTYPCQWYGVVAAGFASGTSPLARLRPVDDEAFCADFDCERVPVGKDGRGRLTHYFRIFTDSGLYVLDLDGVTTRARLYYR